MTYGYCRISTKKQSIDRQERSIKALYPDAIIIKEAFTGTKIVGRKEFIKLLKGVKAGDTIVFDSVSRMSRNAAEGFALYKELYEKGIKLVFLNERHIDTAAFEEAMNGIVSNVSDTGDKATDELVNTIMTAINKFMMNKVEQDIYKAFEQSEKEVEDLKKRTKGGIETARLNGKQIGGVPGKKLTTKKSVKAKELIQKYSHTFQGKKNDEETMVRLEKEKCKIARNTYYKYKKELLAELQTEQEAE